MANCMWNKARKCGGFCEPPHVRVTRGMYMVRVQSQIDKQEKPARKSKRQK